MKVITFSRVFPSYHPRFGESTYFVEKILNWYFGSMQNLEHKPALHFTADIIKRFNPELYQVGGDTTFINSLNINIDSWKNHTIRAGHRWKVGDWFSPRVWSGRPYNSKQIQFAPDIQIKKVYSFSIGLAAIYVDQQRWIDKSFIAKVAANDGLEVEDFLDWFQYPKPFNGQIICWNDQINY